MISLSRLIAAAACAAAACGNANASSFSEASSASASSDSFDAVVVAAIDNQNSMLGDANVAAIPEPETYALMAAGLVGVALMIRRRSAEQR